MIRVWSRCVKVLKSAQNQSLESVYDQCLESGCRSILESVYDQGFVVDVCSVSGVRWKENVGVSVASWFWIRYRCRLESAQDESLNSVCEKFGVSVGSWFSCWCRKSLEPVQKGLESAQDQSLESMYERSGVGVGSEFGVFALSVFGVGLQEYWIQRIIRVLLEKFLVSVCNLSAVLESFGVGSDFRVGVKAVWSRCMLNVWSPVVGKFWRRRIRIWSRCMFSVWSRVVGKIFLESAQDHGFGQVVGSKFGVDVKAVWSLRRIRVRSRCRSTLESIYDQRKD